MTASAAGGDSGLTAPAAGTRSLGRNYHKLWSSSAVSNLADGVFVVALPLIAVRLTDSPMLIAGVSLAGRLPWLDFVLFAGALADRLDRRVTMRNVQLVRVAVVGLMAGLALADSLSLPVLYVAAFVLGVGETLFDTAAQSIMPSIVSKDLLSRANGRLYAVELTMNAFVGPPLGGLLVAVSIPFALGSSALGYGLAAVGLALIVGSFKPRPNGPRQSIVRDIREGFAFLWRVRVLRTLALMVAIGNLTNTAVVAVFVLFAVAPGPMGLDEVGYGLLITAMAVGGLIGSVAEERVEARIGRSAVLLVTVAVGGSMTLIPVVTAQPLVIAAGMVAMGAGFMMWNIITVSLRQRITPDHLLGRLNATYRLFAWGVMPIGALLGGLVAELFGIRAVFLVSSLVMLSTLYFLRYLRDSDLEAAEASVEAGPPSPGPG
jgi:MFS family permease